MSYTSSYVFNKSDRVGNDISYNTEHNIQNNKYSNYNLANYQPDQSTNDIIYFASQNPSFMINGYHRGGGLGDNVTINSQLCITNERNNRAKPATDLRQRMFLSVPYLGRGAGNTTIESKLQRGDSVTKKDNLHNTNTQYVSYIDDDQKKKIQNLDYIAKSNRDRVGENSRYIKQ